MKVTRFLKQKCVRFAAGTIDAYGGTTYSAGVEMSCRWEHQREQVISAEGQEVATSNHIMLDTEVVEGDLFWRGTLTAWNALSITIPVEGESDVIRAVKVEGTPDLSAKYWLWEVWG